MNIEANPPVAFGWSHRPLAGGSPGACSVGGPLTSSLFDPRWVPFTGTES